MIDRTKFFEAVRQDPFGGKLSQGQVAGMGIILDEWERRKLTDLRWLADMLGTVKWETAHTMQPIKEGGSRAYLQSKRYWPWYGRGFVQLTWKDNYKKFQVEVKKLFGVDILAEPDGALLPKPAAYIMFEGMILGTFTGKKLADYYHGEYADFVGSRRIINGLDRAREIGAIKQDFYRALVAVTKETK